MTSKRIRVVLAVALAALAQAGVGRAQEGGKEQLLKELNRDVWVPFSEAFKANDAERFAGLHSKDLVRVESGRKKVLDFEQYAEANRRSFAERKAKGPRVEIAFRFLERLASDKAASERGIFEAAATMPGGEAQRFYGKFHVISRKENGVWKILVDYDSDEGGTIDQKAYQAAFAMDDFGKY